MPATIERRVTTITHRRRTIGAAIGCAAAAAAMVPLAVVLDDAPRTDMTVVNESTLDLGVVVPRRDGAVLHVAHLRAGTRREVPEVLHEGGDVEVIWTHQGTEVGRTIVPEGDDIVTPSDIGKGPTAR